MNAIDLARRAVLGDRNDDYGDPRPDFQRIAKVWSGILGEKLTADITTEEIALLMIGLKLVREAHKPKEDNLIDAHGYLICLEWVKNGIKPQL